MRIEDICIPDTQVLIASILYAVPNANEKSKTAFVTEESRSIQVGILHRAEGTVVEAHQHLPTQKTVSGCQEVLIVKSGTIQATIYDHNKNLLVVRLIKTNDILIQYHGGHSFKFLTDTQFIEVKQGPFTPSDKVFFNPLAHEQMK